MKHRENFSEHETLKNIVLDSEIRNLRDGEFYIRSLNINPTKDQCRKRLERHCTDPHQAFHEYPAKEADEVESVSKAKVDGTGFEIEFQPGG